MPTDEWYVSEVHADSVTESPCASIREACNAARMNSDLVFRMSGVVIVGANGAEVATESRVDDG